MAEGVVAQVLEHDSKMVNALFETMDTCWLLSESRTQKSSENTLEHKRWPGVKA
jgi:hypothetical protein